MIKYLSFLLLVFVQSCDPVEDALDFSPAEKETRKTSFTIRPPLIEDMGFVNLESPVLGESLLLGKGFSFRFQGSYTNYTLLVLKEDPTGLDVEDMVAFLQENMIAGASSFAHKNISMKELQLDKMESKTELYAPDFSSRNGFVSTTKKVELAEMGFVKETPYYWVVWGYGENEEVSASSQVGVFTFGGEEE